MASYSAQCAPAATGDAAGTGIDFHHIWIVFVGLLALCAGRATAADDAGGSSTEALKSLSVEELMDIEVTSVSRRPERYLEAPAAIQVITGDEIRRSGATSIPAALRLASSLSVAQENAHEWVISARGFSSDVGNKLLVLMDGRTVYTPLFSGVFWDRQDYLLADIERIEVISGPGGTLWGANAVNGVINIITKSADDTRGLYLETGAGTDPQSFAGVRYGGAIGESGSWRVYGKYVDRDGETYSGGADAMDSWHMGQGGFRLDAGDSTGASWTLQGDVYRANEGIVTGGRGTVSGGNLLGRYSRTLQGGSDLSLQIYYDRTHLMLPVPEFLFAPAGTLRDDLDTYDLDFQHRFQIGERHSLVWGLGFRLTHDVLENAPALAFFPATLDQRLYSAFVQDEISLGQNLALTLGTKLEHTDYTGFEYEPSVRLQWDLSEKQMVWGAVSRAVRTPSRIDRDLSQPAPGYLIVILQGDEHFDSENLLAWELGYRAQLGTDFSTSVSTFYNKYDELRSTSTSPPDPVFELPFPFFFENNLAGETYGMELSARWQVLDRWRLRAGYNLLQADLRVKPGEEDFNNTLNETADPQQQFSLHSAVEMPWGVEFDADLRWVDRRAVNDSGVPSSVPDYFTLDLRLGWRPAPGVELSVAGRNLLNEYHPEYGLPGPTRVQIERSVYGKIAWSF